MKSRTITNAIMHIPISTLSKYPLEQLFELLSKAETELETARRTKEWLEFAISLKHHNAICTKRLYMHRGISIAHIRNCGSYKLIKSIQYHNKSKIN